MYSTQTKHYEAALKCVQMCCNMDSMDNFQAWTDLRNNSKLKHTEVS